MIEEILKKFIQSRAVGSRVTCNPAPTDTDQDYLCLVDPCVYDLISSELLASGYELDGSRVSDSSSIQKDSGFQSFKMGDINLIITGSLEFYRRFDAASSVAARLNLLDKSDRIALFQAVLYGNPCSSKELEIAP